MQTAFLPLSGRKREHKGFSKITARTLGPRSYPTITGSGRVEACAEFAGGKGEDVEWEQ